MDPNRRYKLLLLFMFSVCSTAADENALLRRLEATEDLVKSLYNRVDHLESREKIYLNRIADLESRDREQQQLIDELSTKLEDHIQTSKQVAQVLSNTEHNMTKDESTVNTQNAEGNEHHHNAERSVQRIRQAEVESPVAFFALLGNHHFEHAGADQVFVFDHVVTNIGSGYNGNLGVFTAPVDGVYVFSTTLLSYYHVDAHASFFRNSDRINTMYVSGSEAGWDTTGATIVLHLQKGDIVSIHNNDSDKMFNGFDHSSFSGFLLSSFSHSPVIVG